MYTVVERCRICGNPRLISLLNLGEQYLTGVFPLNPTDVISKGPLELVRCDGPNACGLVQLHHAYSSNEMYGENYGYRSSLNRTMVDHLHEVVDLLRSRIPVGNDDIILDVGSNDGTLLSFYPDSGPALIGMDPTGVKFKKYYRRDITLIVDFFSAEAFLKATGNRKAKIITSIAMFYDLPDPLQFMREIAAVLHDDGVWHFEQSYLPAMLKANAYDTVCQEHVEYYALKQMIWMTERAGLKILDVVINDVNGGSFAITAARRGSSHQVDDITVQQLVDEEMSLRLDTPVPYAAFAASVAEHRHELRSLLERLKSDGKKVLGYGASTKGNVILQYCGIGQNLLEAIADVNQDKFGHFTPGTNIPIISEEEAHRRKPDYFLALPWHFRKNLLMREADFLRDGGNMIFPLPKLEIVSQ